MQYRAWRRLIGADHPAATDEVLVVAGVAVGLLILDTDAARVHIVDIVVVRERRGQGIASSALRAVIDEAGERTVTLWVWSGNVAARSLYKGLGFVTTAVTAAGYLGMERRPER
jgi:ribosomal protein S18 acetylase RimI-like enzyme